MSDPSPRPSVPTWLVGAMTVILAAQVGLLWMQGVMLERQHGDLKELRQDVQDLSDSFEQFQSAFDQGGQDGFAQPSRRVQRPHRPGLQRVRFQEGESDTGVRKEMEDQRKNEREAIEKARDAREKLSIEENARKAEEKAKVEAAKKTYTPFIWAGVILGLVAMFVRSWLRNRD